MSQITIYLDKDVEVKLKAAAKSNNLSVSKWIAGIIQEKIATEWPKNIVGLAGSWGDEFPTIEEIRSNSGQDCPRESF